jgi:uncharacterized protein with HEPN domain
VSRNTLPASERELAFMRDIITESGDIKEFLKHKNFVDFLADRAIRKAVLVSLLAIAEATKRLSVPTKEKYEDIDWSAIIRFRDKISHHYHDIDYSVIWEIAKGEGLASIVQAIEKELEGRQEPE